MVQISAIALVIIGFLSGMIFGAVGIIVIALTFKGKEETDGSKKEK